MSARLVVDNVSTAGRTVAVAPTLVLPGGHDHDWVLRVVAHEDGYVIEEYGCSTCGELTFR